MDALKEKLDKLEMQNAELNQQNDDLMEQNTEMKEQIAKLVKENEAMKAEKFQQENPTQSVVSNPSSSQNMMVEEKPTDLEEKMIAKSAENSTDLEEKIAKSAKSTSRTYVKNWLFETLAWIGRKEMANSALSTSSKTFKQLCWPKLHGNVKPYEVKILHCWKEFNEESDNYQAKLVIDRGSGWEDEDEIPIASIPPPKYITGFEGIHMDFLNGQIMKFIECILPKLNGISLKFQPKISIWHSMEKITQIRGLCETLTKKAVSINVENFFDFLRFYPNAFGLIENLQSIRMMELSFQKEDNDLLLQWLIKPLPDNKPKLLSVINQHWNYHYDFFERIKKQFIGSTQSVNFIIAFLWDPKCRNFIMENEQTGEVLTLYSNEQHVWQWEFGIWDPPRHLLIRHPKGEEHLKQDWEDQLDQMNKNNKLPSVKIIEIGEF